MAQPSIETPFGDAHATIVSFGSKLTWLYADLAVERDTVKSAKLRVKLSVREEALTDDTFPFAFSLPLEPSDKLESLVYEVTNGREEAISVASTLSR